MARSYHYGVIIAATGVLVAFAALGLGRFALGMLLPAMGKGLSLTYSEMGLISTANFVGYLLAVVASGRLYTTVGPRRLITFGLTLSALSMALVSRATSFWHVFPAYFATGIGSALANVPVMALVSTWFARSTRGRAAGFIVSGIGLGVVLTGIVIPRVNSSLGAEGWRAGWLILCLGAFLVALIAAVFLRNNPRELGLAPLGSDPAAAGAAYAHENPSWVLKILGLIYFFYGFTYVIYATFLVTALVKERGVSEATAGTYWMWVGIFSVFSGPLFGAVSDRIGRKRGLMTVYALQCAAYLLIAVKGPLVLAGGSAFLFGITAWAIPGIMAAAVGDYMGPEKAAAGFGTVTLIFGVGQITGPAAAGWLADATGGFPAGFILAAGMTAVAVFTTKFLPKAG